MPKCKNDSTKTYKGTEPSPKGLGYCAHFEEIGKIKKGLDGNKWIITINKNGIKRWIKYKSYKKYYGGSYDYITTKINIDYYDNTIIISFYDNRFTGEDKDVAKIKWYKIQKEFSNFTWIIPPLEDNILKEYINIHKKYFMTVAEEIIKKMIFIK